MHQAQADRQSAVRYTFWRMSIYRRSVMHLHAIELVRIPLRGAIRHEYWRTIGPQSAGGGLKPLRTCWGGYDEIFFNRRCHRCLICGIR
jgi:hypothetical protein